MRVSIDTDLIKSYIDNYEVDDVVYNGESLNNLVLDGEEVFSNMFIYTLLDNDTYSISGYNSNIVSEITIPSSYKGKNVTAIADSAFYRCNSLMSITIPDSVTSIGWGAFCKCDRLESVVISDSVTNIGEGAFDGCWRLASVEIPDSVTSIGDYAFRGCSSLEAVEIPAGVTRIGYLTFYDCKSLTSIVIPDSVTTINDSAFENCLYLNNINIPTNVTTIGSYAFANCESLTSIEIPSSVTSIGNDAFYNTALTSAIFTCNVWVINSEICRIDDGIDGARALTTYYNDAAWAKYNIVPPVISSVTVSGLSTLNITITNNNSIDLVLLGEVRYTLSTGKTVLYDLTSVTTESLPANGGSRTIIRDCTDQELIPITFDTAHIKAWFEEDPTIESEMYVSSDGTVDSTRLLAPQQTSVSQDTPTEFVFSVYNPNSIQVNCVISLFEPNGSLAVTEVYSVAANSTKTGYVEISSSSAPTYYEMQFNASGHIESNVTADQIS